MSGETATIMDRPEIDVADHASTARSLTKMTVQLLLASGLLIAASFFGVLHRRLACVMFFRSCRPLFPLCSTLVCSFSGRDSNVFWCLLPSRRA